MGAQIIDDLKPEEEEHLVVKKGFGGFSNTPLDTVLRNMGVTTCVVSGVTTCVCVSTTIRVGVEYNYRMIVVSDAVAEVDRTTHEAELRTMARIFADVKTTDEVIGMLGGIDMRLATVEQAFANWLDAARSRLKIPVQARARTKRQIELSFLGINSAIGASLTARDLNVFVEWEGRNWDLLLAFDVCPRLAVGGYICEHGRPEQRTNFPDLEALWRDHLFEPLAEWINGKLAAADAVGLYGSASDGWTHAKLLSNGDPQTSEPNIRIPLGPS